MPRYTLTVVVSFDAEDDGRARAMGHGVLAPSLLRRAGQNQVLEVATLRSGDRSADPFPHPTFLAFVRGPPNDPSVVHAAEIPTTRRP